MANKANNSQTPEIPAFVVKIKTDAFERQIGYNGSVVKLGDRNDWDILMDDAMESKNPGLLELFENIPTDEQWLEIKGEVYLSNNPE